MDDGPAARGIRREDRGRLRAAIEVANIPTLLMVLVHLTGDRRWIEDPYRPTRTRGLEDNDTGGLPESIQRDVRDAALREIAAWREGRPVVLTDPSDELLVEMLAVCMGEPVPPEYAPILREELRYVHPDGTSGGSPRPVPGGAGEPAGNSEHAGSSTSPTTALVIGAGASGLCAAVRLAEAGISYTVIERNDDVGGVWLENRYPACGVDTPSHIYTYSFAPNDWEHYFARRDDIEAYLTRVADDFGVRPHIRFGTEALRATYCEASQRWTVRVRTPDGGTEDLSANVVITAVGAFNKPKMPEVRGQDLFEGVSVHTARWPHEGIDLEGKRVAVIGTGASAMQIVPAIADTVGQLTVFQRSPQWAAPFEKFEQRIPDGVRYLLETMPYYYAWYRLRLAWVFNDKIWPALQKDPSWPHPERSLNSINDGYRRYFTRHIVAELGDRQDLLDDVVPDYPPYGKRILLDNGWFRTLTRSNVELVAQAVKEIRSDRLVAADGREVPADVIIYATGFDVVRFLAPMEVVGRDGRSLHELWDGDDARAYLGAVVPGFPNFFCLYGPNTQFGHGGSVITVMERQIHYVMDIIRHMAEHGAGAVEVREDVWREYNDRVDAAHERMVWTHPGMDTYYRNSKGRVVVNNPFRIVDWWPRTERVDPSEFTIEPRVAAPDPRESVVGMVN